MKAQCYLLFNGNAREAMTYYAGVFGARLDVSPFPESPLVMHARVEKGDLVLMASDCPPEQAATEGNNIFVYLDADSAADVDALLPQLGRGGQILQEAHDSFWGARFGMVTDRYGIGWMLSYTYPKG